MKQINKPKDENKEVPELTRGVHIQGLYQHVIVISDHREDDLNRICNIALALYQDLRRIDRED